MNRLIHTTILNRSSRLVQTLNRMYSSQQIRSVQRLSFNSSLRLNESGNQLNKSQVRSLSSSPICLMQEKPRPDDGKKGETLIGELKPEENSLKRFLKDYGKLGLVVYISVSLSTLIGLYLLLSFNVDLVKLLEILEVSERYTKYMDQYEGGSKFVIAYFISKLLVPFKVAASIGIVTLIDVLKRARKMRKF